MRWVLLVLIGLFALFQYQLWFGEGGVVQKRTLRNQVEQQKTENQVLEKRNRQLRDAVAGLRDGLEGIEERARHDLGMIREGETFYMVIEEDKKP
jgi:cell division protein FtsB